MSDEQVVKRYECTSGNAAWCHGCYTMTEDESGDYVAYEDYATLNQRIATLEAALIEIDGCFEAALVEGWIEALADGDMDRIRDIYSRRIDYVRGIVVTALPTPPTAQGER